ncbi:MAG: ATP-binding protein [bacterium]
MTTMPLSPDSPYKGLIPYASEDAPFFFGRERERELITANLMASRLTLLYGPSGVGKSSVINAGVVSSLRELARENVKTRGLAESIVVAFGAWRDDPVEALKQKIAKAIQEVAPGAKCDQIEPTATLADYLQKWTDCAGSELLIILDQFEEYFLYHPQDIGESSFAEELPRAVNRPGLRANFLISIREDALAKMDFFKGRIPNLFDTYLRIEHLDRKSARAAIQKPVEEFNRRVQANQAVLTEIQLVEAVLDQVKIGQVLWSGSGRGVVDDANQSDRIETPYLQLVMTRLWDEELKAGSHILRLATLKRLGGASSIVRSHLDKTMSALSTAEQESAAQVFRYLVTPSGSKIALTASDLANYTELPEVELTAILNRLSAQDVRILRPLNPPAGVDVATRYEIFHDVLATSILDWQTRSVYEQQIASAKRSLRGLIIPCVLGVIVDFFFCFFPGGAILIWLTLRRKKLALQKELVNAIALGWAFGWMSGWLLYLLLYILLIFGSDLVGAALSTVDSSRVLIAILFIVILPRLLLSPLGSFIAVRRWRRKAEAKFAGKKGTAAAVKAA